MGEVQILEDAQLPEIPADCLFCNYKKKPNYLTSALARKQWTTTNYRFGSGLKISADPFPRNCSKVSSKYSDSTTSSFISCKVFFHNVSASVERFTFSQRGLPYFTVYMMHAFTRRSFKPL